MWREFIQDEKGIASSSRLNMIVGVLVGSFVVIWLTVNGDIGGEIFGIYMFATGGVYGVTKWRESAVEMQQIKSDAAPIEEETYKPKRKPRC